LSLSKRADDVIVGLANGMALRGAADELVQALSLSGKAIHLPDHRTGVAETTLAAAVRAVDEPEGRFQSVAIAERELHDLERG
jgi:hypothetical protein